MNEIEKELLELLSDKNYRVSIRNAGKFRFPANFRFETHAHPEVEIDYITSGCCIMGIGDRIVPLKRGDCIVISPYEKHLFIVDMSKSCSITQLEYSVYLPATILEHITCLTYDKEYYVLNNCESLCEIMENICRYYRSDMNDKYIEAQMNFAMVQMYAMLSKNIKSVQMQSDIKQGKLGDIIDAIHQRLEYEINIEELAMEFSVSSRYIRKEFAEHVGMNCAQYITMLRIAKAKELLWDSSKGITDVGLLTGFNSSQYFCRIFKKHTGMTPMEYRNLWKGTKAKIN